MTDKALEAALLAGFRKGAEDFRPDPEMFVCMDATGCYHVSWNATEHRAKMASLKSTHEAHYVLSALPGEAEVVAWQYSYEMWDGGWSDWSTPMLAKPTNPDFATRPLVTLASLQAMQARAEAAERERDEMATKLTELDLTPSQSTTVGEAVALDGPELFEIIFGAFKGDVPKELTDAKLSEIAASINEAFAEARVKELTAALEFYAKPENYKGEFVPGGRTDHGTFAMAHHVNAVRKDAGEIARKALQHNGEGDTNG